jgi:hypothetical protein
MALEQRRARVLWLNEITAIEDEKIVLREPALAGGLFGDAISETPADRRSFEREGSCYLVRFGPSSAAFPISEGMTDLAVLLSRESQQVSSAELCARLNGARRIPTVAAVELGSPLPVAHGRNGGDSDFVLDKKARASIANRIAEHRAAGRFEEAEELEVHLRRAIDVSGKTRRLGSRRDQDRVNVTKRIKHALEFVKRDLPELYDHFGGDSIFSHGKVQTPLKIGAFCLYRPPTSMNWEVRV